MHSSILHHHNILPLTMSTQPIRVKFLSTVNSHVWLHQLPNANPIFKNCHFLFDDDEDNYDWLVVYEDLPREKGTRFSLGNERVNCNIDNSILFTSEPSSIKTYGLSYTRQFGHVVTSQPYFALPHKNRIYSQASLFWFYGDGKNNKQAYNSISKGPDIQKKTDNVSVVWSNKKQLHTIHFQRIKFLTLLRESLPEIDVFGRGEIPLDDKAEALDKYKYHIAIENHIGKHHWTEKLADAYLGQTLPFYYGCPNINDYFPNDSYISIDIFKPKEAIEIINAAIKNHEFENRLNSIIEARNRLLNEYNIFCVINNIINSYPTKNANNKIQTLYSRRAANRKTIISTFFYLLHKTGNRFYYLTKNLLLKTLKKIFQ